jgi:hypothetical protein
LCGGRLEGAGALQDATRRGWGSGGASGIAPLSTRPAPAEALVRILRPAAAPMSSAGRLAAPRRPVTVHGFALVAFVLGVIVMVITAWPVADGGRSVYRIAVAPAISTHGPPHEQTGADPASAGAGSTRGWRTYTNGRFGFAVRFPNDWPRGEEADNGDGIRLHVGEAANEVVVYATVRQEDAAPAGPLQRPGFEHRSLRLHDGTAASLLVGREGQRVVLDLVRPVGRIEYHVAANVTAAFFERHRDTLLGVARSLQARPERSVYGPGR